MTRQKKGLALIPLCTLLLVSCGRKKDWDEEITVRVFKPKGVEVGKVTVEATQSGKTDKATVEGFGSCDANRVRLIPKQGSSAEVLITVTATTGGLAPVSEKVIPPKTEVNIVLGTSTDIEPAGQCRPSVSPQDGGPDGEPDGQGPKKAVGEPCASPSECEGGKCLTQLTSLGKVIDLPGGYCAEDCAATAGVPCGTDTVECWQNTDGNGTVTSTACVKGCGSAADCPRTDYTCTPGNLCMPEQKP